MESTSFVEQVSGILDLAHTLRQVVSYHARHCVGLTIDQVLVLRHLEQAGGGDTVSGLANGRVRANHTMTAMVRTLEKRGIVMRSRGPRGDQREVWVSLTSTGQEKVESFRGCVAEMVASFPTPPEVIMESLKRITEDLSGLLSLQPNRPET